MTDINPPQVTYIEPGTETFAQRLEACRDLAMCAASASAEIDAMWDAEGSEFFLENHSIKRDGLHPSNNEQQAMLRQHNAQEALVREIEALARDGHLDAAA